jgi:hypothetical protein
MDTACNTGLPETISFRIDAVRMFQLMCSAARANVLVAPDIAKYLEPKELAK